jgi:prepilin signal peptidase PulO-like enzyme (type II secretory pathway)
MILAYIAAGLFGLVFGSFAGATVWRLRARQLIQDKATGEEYDKKELKRLLPLTTSTLTTDRSRCLHCNNELAWYDLLPLASWLSTRGKCRYCHKSIGWFEPVIEIGTATLFVSFLYFWLNVQGIASIADMGLLLIWLTILVMMVIMFAYDAKWFLLPDVIMLPVIGLSAVIALVRIMSAPDVLTEILMTVGSVAILGGLYLLLWLVSRGGWVGFGDVKLGLALGLLLGSWQLAFLALFLANFFGLLVVLPGLVTRKIGRGSHIPFGPMLMLGFIVSLFAGTAIIQGYIEFSMLLMNYTLML